MCTWVQVPVDGRKGHKSLETGVTVLQLCELPNVCAGNRIQVLHKQQVVFTVSLLPTPSTSFDGFTLVSYMEGFHFC